MTLQKLFNTPDDRALYLGRILLGETSAELGDAKTHALTADLGPWGDQDMLRGDLAIIFASELSQRVEKNELDTPEPVTAGDIISWAGVIRAVPRFSRLVYLWRRQVEWDREAGLLKALGQEPPAPLGELHEADEALLATPYETIYDDVVNYYKD